MSESKTQQVTESSGFKIAVIFLAAMANILLAIVLNTITDLRQDGRDTKAKVQQLEITVARDYIRKSDLREIVSGIAQGLKNQN